MLNRSSFLWTCIHHRSEEGGRSNSKNLIVDSTNSRSTKNVSLTLVPPTKEMGSWWWRRRSGGLIVVVVVTTRTLCHGRGANDGTGGVRVTAHCFVKDTAERKDIDGTCRSGLDVRRGRGGGWISFLWRSSGAGIKSTCRWLLLGASLERFEKELWCHVAWWWWWWWWWWW